MIYPTTLFRSLKELHWTISSASWGASREPHITAYMEPLEITPPDSHRAAEGLASVCVCMYRYRNAKVVYVYIYIYVCVCMGVCVSIIDTDVHVFVNTN